MSNWIIWNKTVLTLTLCIAQSAGAVECTDCASAAGWDLPSGYPGCDTEQSGVEVSVMLELWGVQSAPSLLLLPGPLWPGVVAPDGALSVG